MNGDHNRSEQQNRWERGMLLVGLLVGFWLRLFRLGAESLWYDETVSVMLARKTPAEMVAHTARDIHPPGYYALLHGWQTFADPTPAHGLEFLFAWPSLWAGVLILALLYPLGRRLVGARAALLAVWLAAVNPFHLWYGQEVRMYTVGGALGLLCLWALLRFADQQRGSMGWLIAYVICAATGLYTLYYFALLLIAVNLVAVFLLWRKAALQRGGEEGEPARRTGRDAGGSLIWWIAAQVAVVALWLPWLPVFVRQVTDPPVPGWRTPWTNWPQIAGAMSEGLGALFIGQTPPGMLMWPYALMTLAVVLLFLWPGKPARVRQAARPILLIYTFVPVALIYLLTAAVTPLYHVRYLFIYAPPFALMLAVAVLRVGDLRRWLGVAAAVLIFAVSGLGLYQFWTNDAYRSDDHRAAVAELARDWRPGDLVLVNAGWVYPALETYWPTELTGPLDAAPPPIVWSGRFTDYADRLQQGEISAEPDRSRPPVFVARTGSVDGEPSLGWGDPESDFFAVSKDETTAALQLMAGAHPRIWHYRLYDTVSDPDGVVRDWLATAGTLRVDRPWPGRDFLRVQRYDFDVQDGPEMVMIGEDVAFGDAVRLVGRAPFAPVEAGEIFYVDTRWEALPALADLGTDLSVSLRLYAGGEMVLQQDGPFDPPSGGWRPAQPHRQHFALPIPAATEPMAYQVQIVVYRQDGGMALTPVGDDARIIEGQRWLLGDNDVLRATHPPPNGAHWEAGIR